MVFIIYKAVTETLCYLIPRMCIWGYSISYRVQVSPVQQVSTDCLVWAGADMLGVWEARGLCSNGTHG